MEGSHMGMATADGRGVHAVCSMVHAVVGSGLGHRRWATTARAAHAADNLRTWEQSSVSTFETERRVRDGF
eukprot:6404104-Prymnesium_polylepis.2